MRKHCPHRRRFIKAVGLALPAIALPSIASSARGRSSADEPHRLRFYHQHTREELDIVYRDGHIYRRQALKKINTLLRDFRSGEIHPIDPSLLDFLEAVQKRTGSVGPYEIISGFRSPETNAMLRSQTDGVATRSLHMKGKAIDVRLTDIPTQALREAALALRRGGVGYYPKSNFIHLDTGRFRSW